VLVLGCFRDLAAGDEHGDLFRVHTRYSLGIAPMNPHRLSFAGSSTGFPLRQPL
jgi:hypothetical protein